MVGTLTARRRNDLAPSGCRGLAGWQSWWPRTRWRPARLGGHLAVTLKPQREWALWKVAATGGSVGGCMSAGPRAVAGKPKCGTGSGTELATSLR